MTAPHHSVEVEVEEVPVGEVVPIGEVTEEEETSDREAAVVDEVEVVVGAVEVVGVEAGVVEDNKTPHRKINSIKN